MSDETPETPGDSSPDDSTGPETHPEGTLPDETNRDAASGDPADASAADASAADTTVPPGADSPGESTLLSDEATLPPHAAGPAPVAESTLSETPAPADQDDEATLPPRAAGEVSGRDMDTVVSAAPGGQGAAPAAGTRVQYFGEYELLQEIARGGMGVVYKARQSRLNRIVALKMILSGQLASQEDVQRFYIEAEAAASLEHPGIVPIYEIGEHEGQHFFSMGFIDGAGLDVRVKDGPMSPREAAAVTQQVCEAIAYAHSQNVIHRDLKPANVLIDGTGQAKVTDFGLAKKTDADSGLTGTGQILGTPGYMPPEQASGETDTIGPAADIYSLGAILYALLTGRPPFQSSNVMDTLVAVLEQEPVAPRQLNPALDVDLETICLKCLEKDAARRYATTDELVDELGRYLNGEPIHARPIGKLERGWRWCKRKPALAGLSALAVVMLLTLGIGGPLVALQQAALTEQAVTAQNDAERQRRNAAQKASEAERARQKAQDSEQVAVQAGERLLAQKINMNLEAGIRLSDDEKPSRAYARFATALQLQSSEADTVSEQLNRLHLNSVLRHCPRPSFIYPLETAKLSHCDFSADGESVVVAEFNGVVRLLNTDTGKPLIEALEHDGYVGSIALSPDNSRLAVGIVYESAGQPSTTVRIWDLGQRKKTSTRVKFDQMAEVAAFHPDGRRLVIRSGDQVVIWDSETGETLHTLKHTAEVGEARLFPNGKRLATVSGEEGCVIWDCDTGQRIGQPLKHEWHTVRKCAISADGTRIATGAYGEARIWDTESFQPVTGVLDFTARTQDIQFSHDGTMLLVATQNWDTHVWNAHTGQRLLSPLTHQGVVTAACFSADDRHILTGSVDGTARIWSVENGQLLKTFRHNKPVRYVAFHPDCRRVLTGSDVGGILQSSGAEVRVWDQAVTQVSADATLSHNEDVQTLAISPDGNLIATGCDDHRVRLWSTEHGKLALPPVLLGEPVAEVSFHAGGDVLFARGATRTVAAWDVSTGNPIGTPIRVETELADATMSPDGQFIATTGKDGSVQQWDARTGERLAKVAAFPLPGGREFRFGEIRFDPTGTCLTGIHGHFPALGLVRSWRPGSTDDGPISAVATTPGIGIPGTPDNALPISGFPEAITFTPDGSRCVIAMASPEDMRGKLFHVQVFSVEPFGPVFEQPVEVDESVNRVVFSPDGSTFATASDSNVARVWDSQTGQPVTRPMKQAGDVDWVNFSPDGRLVVTCGTLTDNQGCARVWDASTGQPVTEELPHPNSVHRAAFHPDGLRIITACSDDRVRIWNLSPDDRSPKEISRTAEFLSGQRMDEDGYEQFIDDTALQEGWSEFIKAGLPTRPTSQQIIAWHQKELQSTDPLRDARMRAIHYGAMIAADSMSWMRWRRAEVHTALGQYRQAAADYSALTPPVKPGFTQHLFTGAKPGLPIGEGDRLFTWVFLDADQPPEELMLQFNNGEWDHRAYWGANRLDFGLDGSASRLAMGPLPAAGEWVRLEVEAQAVGLKPGDVVNGWAFTQFGGRVHWDQAGIVSPVADNASGDIVIEDADDKTADEERTERETVWIEDSLPAGAVAASSEGGRTWKWVDADHGPVYSWDRSHTQEFPSSWILIRAALNARLADDQDALSDYRKRVIDRTNGNDEASRLEAAVMLLLIDPDDTSDQKQLTDLLKRLQTAAPDNPRVPLLDALSRTRAGQAEMAVESLTEWMTRTESADSGKEPSDMAIGHLIMGIAAARAGRPEQSIRDSLNRADSIITDREYQFSTWPHWLYCEILKQELETLLPQTPVPETSSSDGTEDKEKPK